jgi:argininosuccinate synthase
MKTGWSIVRGEYAYVRTYPTNFGSRRRTIQLAIVAGCRDINTMQVHYRATVRGNEAVRFDTKEDAMRWVEATVVLQQE